MDKRLSYILKLLEGYCACYERMYGHKPRAIGQLKEIRG